MVRMFALLVLVLVYTEARSEDEIPRGSCTIVNTSEDPVVIGLYRPLQSGVDEELVRVPAKTELRNVPVDLAPGDQYLIAYDAVLDADQIKRSHPIQIHGHKLMQFISDAKDPETPDVLIQYLGAPEVVGRRDRNEAIRLAPHESEAKRILRSANYTSRLVPTPLTQTQFPNESKIQRAERRDR